MPLAAPLLTGVVIYDYNPCSDQGATEHETDAAGLMDQGSPQGI